MAGIFSSQNATAAYNVKILFAEKPPQEGGEFKNYAAYAAALGSAAMPEVDWKGLDGYWLKADRTDRNIRWRTAMAVIVVGKTTNRLMPFVQIRDFYFLLNIEAETIKHQILWFKGALYLVDFLASWFNDERSDNVISKTTLNELRQILAALNKDIANWAIEFKIFDLLVGEHENQPLVEEKAFEYDRDFVRDEQFRDAVRNIYADAKTNTPLTLNRFNNVFNGQGVLANIANYFMPYIPVFSEYYDSDLTKDEDIPEPTPPLIHPLYYFGAISTRHGQEARIQVPLLMLYPNEYMVMDDIFRNAPAVLEIKKGLSDNPDNKVFSAYNTVNADILKKRYK